MEKQCSKCKQIKSVDEFHRWLIKGKLYIRPDCKECRKKYLKSEHAIKLRRQYRAKPENRKKASIYAKQKKEEYQQIVFNHYGNKCECCGENEKLFLEIDHKDNTGKEWRKKYRTGMKLYYYIVKLGFPKNLRILCANCNRGRWRNGGICPHKR